MDINELETADYDILENAKAAFYRLWKLKTVVILSTLIGILAFLSFLSIVGNSVVYRSHAAIYSALYGSAQESSEGVRVMNSYASMLGTDRVCERAAETLNDPDFTLGTLSSMVRSGEIRLEGASTNSREYGYRLTLIVATENPNRIMDVTNAMAQAFSDEINDLLGSSSLKVLDVATTYTSYHSINEKMWLLLFAAAGFFVSAGFIFLKEFFSPKVYTVGQCEKNQKLILGMVPYSVKK